MQLGESRKKNICFIIQCQQHYFKLLYVAKLLDEEFNISFLIDDYQFRFSKDDLNNCCYKRITLFKDNPFFSKECKLPPLQKKKEVSLNFKIVNKLIYVIWRPVMVMGYALLSKKSFVSNWGGEFEKMKDNLKHKIKADFRRFHSVLIGFRALCANLKVFREFFGDKRVILINRHILKDSVRKKIKSIPWIYFILMRFSTFYKTLIYKRVIDAIKDHLLFNNYDIVILAEANVEYLSEAYIQVFKKFNIPSLIIPYTFCSPTEPAQSYYNDRNRRYHWYHKFFISRKWVYSFNERKLLRMPFINILGMNRLGIVPPQPWVQESSTANALVAESNMMKRHYLKHNIKSESIACIGDVSYDILFEYYENKASTKLTLCEELMLDKNKKIITFGVFPDFMDKFACNTGFENYRDMIHFICMELKKIEYFELVLCLHPALKREDFRHIEELGIKISSRSTPELIAISDLYVASISATIRWAISLGIPVINYDCYQFRYGDYNHVPGVVNVETQQEFSEAIDRFKNDPSYLQYLASRLKLVKQDWGVIDGRFHLRLKSLINELIERSDNESSSNRMRQDGFEACSSLDRATA